MRLLIALSCALAFAISALGMDFHPADLDQDQRISIEELTAYAVAHTEESAWPSGPSPVGKADLDRARFIWRNGERYGKVEVLPVDQAWVPAPLDGSVFATLLDLRPEPLDTSEIFGLPLGLEELDLEYRLEGEAFSRFAPLLDLGEDRWAMAVPYAQGAPGGARPMELWIRSGAERFPTVPIDPVGLPSGAGTFAAVASGFASVASLAGELLGDDPELYYDADPEEIPANLRPLVMVDRVLRDPANPNSLARLLDGTAPILVDEEIDRAELEAVVAKLGLVERLESLRSIMTFDAEPFSASPSGPARPLGIASIGEPLPSSAFLSIGTLGQLAAAMKQQCAADRIANPDQAVQNLKNNANMAAVMLALAGPVGAVAAASYSVSNWAIENYHQVIANQWPSEVYNVQLDFSPAFSVEDDCAPSSWNSTMSASSKDWSLDKTVVTGAFSLFGAYGAGAGAASQAVATTSERVGGLVIDMSGVSLDRAFPDTNVIPVPAAVWGGITVTDADLNLIEMAFEGDSVAQGSSKREVIPKAVGTTIVRMRTLPGALGPCSVVEGAAQFYEVRANEVVVTPSGGQVTPNQEIEFTAIVSNAKNKDLDFWVSHGVIYEETHDLVSGVHIAKWRAPPEEEMPKGPITLTARSLANECLRAGKTLEAEAVLTPFVNDYFIDPVVFCLNPGEQQIFELVDAKLGEIPTVEWELIGPGFLNGEGPFATFSAFDEGKAVIRATVLVEEGDPVVVEREVLIGCGLTAMMQFPPDGGPALDAVVKTNVAGLFIGTLGLVDSDLFFEYNELQLPTEDNPTGLARGTFSGAGMYFPADPDEGAALIDDSEALKSYFVQNEHGTPFEYFVEAGFSLVFVSDDENTIELLGGQNGDSMRIRLDAGVSGAGSLPNEQGNEIVAYNWSFSDGDLLVGKEVYKTFSRSLNELTIDLQVVDTLGNFAFYRQTLLIVRLAGNFAFPYHPSGAFVSGWPWEDSGDPPPPFEGESGFLVFIANPDDLRMELAVIGAVRTRVSAHTSGALLVDEEDAHFYTITFFP